MSKALFALALLAGSVVPHVADACIPEELTRYEAVIEAAAELYALPAPLLWAVFYTESGGRENAVSPVGAVGVAQLMPATARSQGVWNRANPFQSILAGTRYLRLQVNRFGGNLRLALAAYNAGPGAVGRYQGVPPFRETMRYVPKVLGRYWQFLACQRGEK